MRCPTCGRPMADGHITGSSMPHLIPGTPKGLTRRFSQEDVEKLNISPDTKGWFLDVCFTGMAPWLPAEYCEKCGYVICQLNMLTPKKEETL